MDAISPAVHFGAPEAVLWNDERRESGYAGWIGIAQRTKPVNQGIAVVDAWGWAALAVLQRLDGKVMIVAVNQQNGLAESGRALLDGIEGEALDRYCRYECGKCHVSPDASETCLCATVVSAARR